MREATLESSSFAVTVLVNVEAAHYQDALEAVEEMVAEFPDADVLDLMERDDNLRNMS